MNFYDEYKTLNARLARGGPAWFGSLVEKAGPWAEEDRALTYPRIGIYSGAGTSHSWLWYVDLFDRLGFYDLVFLNESSVSSGGLAGLDVLAMSGGDTFAVAQALGPAGAAAIESFVRGGGLYIGACAGAYLPLNSSKEPLHHFNWVNARIRNLTTLLPEPLCLSEKFCVSYGCSFIFHPVREAVRLHPLKVPPFDLFSDFTAPLYGGPPMTAGPGALVLAVYTDFTPKTRFLVNRPLAEKVVLDSAAVVKSPLGRGWFYLFGPHFEHPRFSEANRILAQTIYYDAPRRAEKRPPVDSGLRPLVRAEGGLLRDLKREISNSRLVAAGLETRPVSWIIGQKVYEPVKLRVFLEALWTRIKSLEKAGHLMASPNEAARLKELAETTTLLVRQLKNELDEKTDTSGLAARTFKILGRLSSLFLTVYFRTKLAGLIGSETGADEAPVY